MIKSDLIDEVAKRAKTTNKAAESVINTVFDTIAEALARGDRLELRGFGSLRVKDYKAYTGRNPKTGAKIEVQPKRLPVFKPGKEIMTKLNAGFQGDEGTGGESDG